MTNKIQIQSNKTHAFGDEEIVTPLESRALFWRPRFQRSAHELVHVPFLFGLVFSQRPRTVVTIGDATGTAHFAFCQAIEKLDLDTRCLGVGPWGSEQGFNVPEDLADYNEETYPELSQLTGTPPLTAARRFPEGSVDLLFVSMTSGADQQEIDQWLDAEWLPRISSRGILIMSAVGDALERFESGSVLDRLLKKYPHFHLDTGGGLLLIAIGNEQNDKLRRLCEVKIGGPGYSALMQVLSRLGRGLQMEVAARQDGKKLSETKKDLKVIRAQVSTLEEHKQTLQTDYQTLQKSYEERSRVAAEAQAKGFEALETAAAELAALRKLESNVAESAEDLAIVLENAEISASGRDATLEEVKGAKERLAQILDKQSEAGAGHTHVLAILIQEAEATIIRRDENIELLREQISECNAELAARVEAERALQGAIAAQLESASLTSAGGHDFQMPDMATSPFFDQLSALTEAFERRQIAMDEHLEDNRRIAQDLAQERDALAGLLKDSGIEVDDVLYRLQPAEALRKGQTSTARGEYATDEDGMALQQKLKNQLASLDVLRATLRQA